MRKSAGKRPSSALSASASAPVLKSSLRDFENGFQSRPTTSSGSQPLSNETASKGGPRTAGSISTKSLRPQSAALGSSIRQGVDTSPQWAESSLQLSFGGSSGNRSSPNLVVETVDYSRGQLVNGLAPSTNSVNERTQHEVALRSEVSPIKASAGRLASVGFEIKDMMTSDETLKSFESLENDLQDMKRSIRMEDFNEAKLDKDEERRAEERRIREERARRLREKAREGKDPRRRVAAMLEQGREFGQVQNTKKVLTLPVQVQISKTSNRAERIEMVDVSALQAKCTGLNTGSTNFKAIKDVADEQEKQKKWLLSTAPSLELRKDFVKQNKALGNALSKTSRHAAETALKQGAKQHLVTKRRPSAHQVHTAKKTLDAAQEEKDSQKEHPVPSSLASRRSIASPALLSPSSSTPKRGSILSPLSGSRLSPPQKEQKGSWTALRGHLGLSRAATSSSPSRKDQPAPPAERFKELRRKLDLSKRARALWSVVKGAFAFVLLFRRVQMRDRSHQIVLEIVMKLADRSRLLLAVKSFRKKVCRLQRKTRAFMARKRAWCEEAGILWQQIEDRNLHAHHKLKEQERLLRELKTGGLRQERRPSKEEAAAAEQGTPEERMDRLLYPWKIYRIPRPKRMFTLARFYFFKAKHKRQQLDAWADAAALKAGLYKEMENYFKLYGISSEEIRDLLKDEERQEESPPATPVKAEPVRAERRRADATSEVRNAKTALLSEAEAIGLINLAAFELRERKPFQDHPANQFLEVSEGTVGQMSQRFRKIIQQRHDMDANEEPLARRKSSSSTAWGISRPEPVEVAPEPEIEDQEPELVFDAVMQRFSPRFLQETVTAKREARDAGEVDGSELESLGVGGPRGPEPPDSEDDD